MITAEPSVRNRSCTGHPLGLRRGLARRTVDNATRRQVLAAVAALGAGWVTVGCGSGERGPAAGTRVVADALGEVEIPTAPRRVVALYDDVLDLALALGFTVIAGPGERGSATNPFPAHLPAESVQGVERIETIGDGPFPEVLAALAPDLFLSNFVEDEATETRDMLSPIAPVYTFRMYGEGGWRGGAEDLARTFGREQDLQRIFSDVDARTEAVAQVVAGGGRRVALGTATADGGIQLYGGPTTPALTVLTGLGFTEAPISGGMEYQELSAERLGDVDTDVFVFFQFGANPIDELTAGPLWDPRIQNITVPSSQYYFSPRSELAFLDSIEAAFT